MDNVCQHVHILHGSSQDLRKYHQKRDKRIRVFARIDPTCVRQNEDILNHLTGFFADMLAASSPYLSGGLPERTVSGALTPKS